MSGRRTLAYLCIYVYVANSCVNYQFSLVMADPYRGPRRTITDGIGTVSAVHKRAYLLPRSACAGGCIGDPWVRGIPADYHGPDVIGILLRCHTARPSGRAEHNEPLRRANWRAIRDRRARCCRRESLCRLARRTAVSRQWRLIIIRYLAF
jgi:hypothetical protein